MDFNISSLLGGDTVTNSGSGVLGLGVISHSSLAGELISIFWDEAPRNGGVEEDEEVVGGGEGGGGGGGGGGGEVQLIEEGSIKYERVEYITTKGEGT